MTSLWKRTLFWVPRALSIIFIAFIGLFALDVFSEQGALNILVGLAIHLIPSFVLILILVLAWRREWIGAISFGTAGILYMLTILPRQGIPADVKVLWSLTVAGPAFVIAALFWLNWLKHDELRRLE